jgi:hypothetical protein
MIISVSLGIFPSSYRTQIHIQLVEEQNIKAISEMESLPLPSSEKPKD